MKRTKREKSQKYAGVYFRFDAIGKERTYYIVYRQGGRETKLIEEPVGKASCGMTEAKAAQIRADRMRGKDKSNTAKRKECADIRQTERDRWTLDRIWQAYQEAHPEHKSRQRDISRYNTHIAPYFGQRTPEEMLTADIDTFKAESLKAGKSNGTIQRVISQLRAIINFGVKRGLCQPLHPGRLTIESIHVDGEKTEMLTEEQVVHLLEALDAESDQDAAALIRLAMVTGMRKGALLALQWEDCDFVRNIITLRGATAKKGVTEHIPMNEAARAILLNISRTKSSFVFPGKDGYQRKDYRRIARRVKKNAGLPVDFRPLHGLRHHFASFLASSGKVDLYTLQKLLTHSSRQMTQRYAHLADDAMKRAACVADSILIRTPVDIEREAQRGEDGNAQGLQNYSEKYSRR